MCQPAEAVVTAFDAARILQGLVTARGGKQHMLPTSTGTHIIGTACTCTYYVRTCMRMYDTTREENIKQQTVPLRTAKETL